MSGKDLMKTIICSDPQNHYGITSGGECVRMLGPIFGDYFDGIINHREPNSLEDNTMYVYCDTYLTCIAENTVTITKSSLGMRTGGFFDFLQPHPSNGGITEKVTSVYFDGRIIAYYITRRNILITCDMSHCEIDIELTKYIAEDLITLLELKPLRDKKITEKYHKVSLGSITVGCDPEFEFVQDNEVVNADSYLRDGDGGADKEIGLDGSGDQIELRPKPGTPIEVVNHMHTLINKFCQAYDGARLAISGHVYPLGGHIHVGIGNKLKDYYGVTTLLDSFIGEQVLDLSGRARDGYKQLTAYKEQPHGFEYRTPPSAVFYNKKLTKIFLKLTRHLTYTYTKNVGKALTFHKIPTKEEYVKIGGISSKEYDYFSRTLKDLKSKMKNEVLYAQWGLNAIPPKSGTEVRRNVVIETSFADDWDGGVRNNTENAFTSYLKKKGTEVGLLVTNTRARKIKVKFFGFQESRGIVTNLPGLYYLEKIDGINTSKAVVAQDGILCITIGLPRKYRMDTFFGVFTCDNIIYNLECHIQDTHFDS